MLPPALWGRGAGEWDMAVPHSTPTPDPHPIDRVCRAVLNGFASLNRFLRAAGRGNFVGRCCVERIGRAGSAFSTREGTMETKNDLSPAPTVVLTDDARQGVTGHNVRYVLGFGIAGAVISFVLVGLLTAHQLYGSLW
jgi:hypothetical protein